jgi:hypothetical protein
MKTRENSYYLTDPGTWWFDWLKDPDHYWDKRVQSLRSTDDEEEDAYEHQAEINALTEIFDES